MIAREEAPEEVSMDTHSALEATVLTPRRLRKTTKGLTDMMQRRQRRSDSTDESPPSFLTTITSSEAPQIQDSPSPQRNDLLATAKSIAIDASIERRSPIALGCIQSLLMHSALIEHPPGTT